MSFSPHFPPNVLRVFELVAADYLLVTFFTFSLLSLCVSIGSIVVFS